MCGIMGYNGKLQAVPFLISGLERLEYRGYDSAGIAVMTDSGIETKKKKGRIALLKEEVNGEDKPNATMGIGHTRWATHGKPSNENAHPHSVGRFTVVHNGIIENYAELKSEHLNGYAFKSETDTEVIAALLDKFFSGNTLEAIGKTAQLLKGSFAIAAMNAEEKDKIYCLRVASPLIIGKGEGCFIASDIGAIGDRADIFYRMDDGEIAQVSKEEIKFFDFSLNSIEKEPSKFSREFTAVGKGKFEHFMLKEIYEQPEAVKRTTQKYINNNIIDFNIAIDKPSRIYFVACGSAYHAAITAKYVFEAITKIPTEIDIASEFRYRNPILSRDTPVIIISQSGETADSLAALREAKAQGAQTISIVNVAESSIATESDFVIQTMAGPEIAVATTKAYSAQLAAIYMLAAYFAKRFGTAENKKIEGLIKDISLLHEKIEKALECEKQIKALAQKLKNIEHAYFIGRGLGYAAAAEASLKLKEISYIHSEAYAAGELKHGTISLIEKGTSVIALDSQSNLSHKLQSNIDEVKARGASIIAISDSEKIKADETIAVPRVNPLLTTSVQIIPIQLLSYHVARLRGCDIDKPRNLAKSVTVE